MVPPNPLTSMIRTPASTRATASSLQIPAPVSFTMMGTFPLAADPMASISPPPQHSPSGWILSWRKFRWMARASASIISASLSKISGPSFLSCTAPMLPTTGTPGAASLTTEKVSSIIGSSRAALCEPTPRATPTSWAARARFRLISLVSGCPPVMPQIIRGAARSLPRNRHLVLTSEASMPGSALGTSIRSLKGLQAASISSSKQILM